MQTELQPIPSRYVEMMDGKPATTSVIVAQHFGKRHKHVLRDIQNLEIPDDFNRTNFGPIDYIDSRGREQRMVRMTKDGFMLLAMGFTGKKAMAIKIEFIRQFNEMEQVLLELAEKAMRDAQSEAESYLSITSKEYIHLLKFKISALERRVKIQKRETSGHFNGVIRRPISDNEKYSIVRLYETGHGLVEIAEAVGRRRETIYNFLKRNGALGKKEVPA